MIEQYIVDVLGDDATVTAKVGARIFPLVVRKETTWPMLTYNLLSSTGEYTLAGPMGWRTAQIDMTAWATDYKPAKELAEAVRAALDGFSQAMTVGPIKWIQVAFNPDDYVDEMGVYACGMTLQVEYDDTWVKPS